MTHALIRATITPKVIEMIAEWLEIEEAEALDVFYGSTTAASLADDETGLYGQSPLFTFSLFREEWEKAQREQGATRLR